MTKAPIMLEGCNERYSLLQDQFHLEKLQNRDTIQIMTNQLIIEHNKSNEWKKKARKRVLIFGGGGFVVGLLFGLFL